MAQLLCSTCIYAKVCKHYKKELKDVVSIPFFIYECSLYESESDFLKRRKELILEELKKEVRRNEILQGKLDAIAFSISGGKYGKVY